MRKKKLTCSGGLDGVLGVVALPLGVVGHDREAVLRAGLEVRHLEGAGVLRADVHEEVVLAALLLHPEPVGLLEAPVEAGLPDQAHGLVGNAEDPEVVGRVRVALDVQDNGVLVRAEHVGRHALVLPVVGRVDVLDIEGGLPGQGVRLGHLHRVLGRLLDLGGGGELLALLLPEEGYVVGPRGPAHQLPLLAPVEARLGGARGLVDIRLICNI